MPTCEDSRDTRSPVRRSNEERENANALEPCHSVGTQGRHYQQSHPPSNFSLPFLFLWIFATWKFEVKKTNLGACWYAGLVRSFVVAYINVSCQGLATYMLLSWKYARSAVTKNILCVAEYLELGCKLFSEEGITICLLGMCNLWKREQWRLDYVEVYLPRHVMDWTVWHRCL